MNQVMNCEKFAQLLDAYLDGELDIKAIAELESHAHTCPECHTQLEMASHIKEMCEKLDANVTMPIEGQASWRRAIRQEAAQQAKPAARKGAPAWLRSVSGMAAALLLVAGGTFAYKQANPMVFEANVMSEQGYTKAAMSYDLGDMAPAALAGRGHILMSDGAMEDEVAMEAEANVAEATMVDPQSGFAPEVDKDEAKEIRYASRSIDSANYDADLSSIKDYVEEYAGRIVNQNEYTLPDRTTSPEGTRRNIHISAQVPTVDLDAFLTAIDVVGTVTERSENRYEITRQYYDSVTRLDNQKALRQKLQAMIPDAKTVTELIEIERELADVQADIDNLEGQLRGWDVQIDYASVDINLTEVKNKMAVLPIDKLSLGERVQEGFVQSINMLGSFAQDMLVFVAMFWPWLLLAIIVIIGISASVKRRRKNRE